MAMARLFTALCGVLALISIADAAKTYRGEGTAYSDGYDKDATGFNSCGFGKLADRFEKYFCALPSHIFDRKEHCGKCIAVRGTDKGATGKWVKMMVVDECPTCPGDGDVDMSSPAFEDSTGFSWDRKSIEYKFVDCDSADEADYKSNDEEQADDNSDSNNDSSTDDSSSDDSSESSNSDESDNNDNKKKKRKHSSDRRLLRA